MGQQTGTGGQKGSQPPQLTGTGPSTLTGTANIQNSTTPAGQQYNNANAMKTSYSDYLSSLLGNDNMQQVGNAGNSPYANTPNPIPQSAAPSYMAGAMQNTIGGPGGGGKQGKGGQPPQPGGAGQQTGSNGQSLIGDMLKGGGQTGPGAAPPPGQQVTTDYGAPGSERRKLFDAAFNTAGTGDNAGVMGDTSTDAGKAAMFGEIGSARRAAFDKAFASQNGTAPGAAGTPATGTPWDRQTSAGPAQLTPEQQAATMKQQNETALAGFSAGAGPHGSAPTIQGGYTGTKDAQGRPAFMSDPNYGANPSQSMLKDTSNAKVQAQGAFAKNTYNDRMNFFLAQTNDREKADFLSKNRDIASDIRTKMGPQAYNQWIGYAAYSPYQGTT